MSLLLNELHAIDYTFKQNKYMYVCMYVCMYV